MPVKVAIFTAPLRQGIGALVIDAFQPECNRDLRKRVLESFRLKDMIGAINSACQSPYGEPKDSLDQDSTRNF